MHKHFLIFCLVAGFAGCSEKPAGEEPVVPESDETPMIPDLPGQTDNPENESAPPITGHSATPESKPMPPYYVASDSLSVRSGPGMAYPIVDYLRLGAQVQVLAESGVWLKIGESRYVSRRYVQPNAP